MVSRPDHSPTSQAMQTSTLPESHSDEESVYTLDEPPAYERSPFRPPADQEFINQNPAVGADGRIDLDFDSKLGRALASVVPHPPPYPSHSHIERRDWHIKLNIVIQVVGSRGDVQPFIALGNELQKHGHRVRLATHNVFEDFVRKSGLEFHPIGGDPAELMAYMVKNPGLIPSMKSLRQGDIQRKRAMVMEMLEGCWRSCVEPDTVSHTPFVAEAIIANPPSFAHVHCAQALGIPVHLMFTMPWTSTRAFAHPLANLKYSSTDPALANYISYGAVEFLTWHALSDLINKWRRSLDLEAVPLSEGPDLVDTLKIPFTYCWSPALVPKPADWASHIDVCGFFFRDPPSYTPPPELDAFLRAGPPPVYIGFGSIVMDDPDRMINVVLQAVRTAGVRAIVSSGWSKLDGPPSPAVFFLKECPHEWLFQHVAAVVHHGGAGTTACGLLNGKPTTIVPFFGDQPFWGNMVAAAGAGPKPVHHKALDVQNLAEAITFCLTPEAAAAARTIANKMRGESGVKDAVASFHANLPLAGLQCDILPDRPAAWSIEKGKGKMRLSKLAAEVLLRDSAFDPKTLKPHATKRIHIENRRWDPVTGFTSAALATATDLVDATAGIVVRPYQAFKHSNPGGPSSATALSKDDRGEGSSSSSGARYSNSGILSTAPSSMPSFHANEEGYTPEQLELSGSTIPLSSPSSFQVDQDAKGKGPSLHPVNDKWEGSSRGISTAGAMAAASGKSVGEVFGSFSKGLFLDIPLAVTEGMRGVPKLYGEEVKDYGQIRDWKSGAAVAGRTFAHEFPAGLADMAVQSYKGAKAGGALGFVKGFGKGTVGLVTKTNASVLGLVFYPTQGIYKSLRAAAHTKTTKGIVKARREEGKWLMGCFTPDSLASTARVRDEIYPYNYTKLYSYEYTKV
ncbi:hypothetical protein DFH06DRAFT_567895 [Mycena polygramma]|nr:hypothetical protein DFH06DRAFT_567895 [Mycena polygramma]